MVESHQRMLGAVTQVLGIDKMSLRQLSSPQLLLEFSVFFAGGVRWCPPLSGEPPWGCLKLLVGLLFGFTVLCILRSINVCIFLKIPCVWYFTGVVPRSFNVCVQSVAWFLLLGR